MTDFEEEARILREKNSELVQEVQYWKITAAQREKDKLELMKDINELRLKLTRLRSGGAAQARKLDAGLQIASEEALSHLVQASGAVTRAMELAKQYIRDRQEFDDKSPRWSTIGGSPTTEKVHRVPPLLMGGQSIQPVVSLSRTMLNSSIRSRNQNNNVTERAIPMRLLQDVYIPLTRIDMADIQANNMEIEADNSVEDLELEDSSEQALDESLNLSEDYETSRRLDAVMEDLEMEDEVETPPSFRADSPLEGPSWLLDAPAESQSPMERMTLEPDSTTSCEGVAIPGPAAAPADHTPHPPEEPEPEHTAHAFTPTVRRRKRSASPPPARRAAPARSPPPPPPAPAHLSPRHNNHNDNRVLKVMVAKMRMSGGGDASPPAASTRAPPSRRSTTDASDSPAHAPSSPELSPRSPERSPPRRAEASPPKRPMRFDAPSPNGATDSGVIVSIQQESRASGEPAATSRAVSRCDSRSGSRVSRSHSRQSDDSRSQSRQSYDSRSQSRINGCDSEGEGSATLFAMQGRSRRTRKAVTYKEKPLNRKMRR